MGRLQCELEGCCKQAISVVTPHCAAHGGGRRCQTVDCSKSAQGDTGHCKGHGGGRRCQTVDCLKSARGDTGHCIGHGGGRRCQHEGCSKAAVQDGTDHCKTHGGGAGGASTWAAPRLLRQAAHSIARRMEAAGGASRRAASRLSLKLPAVCTASCVHRAHSPTMRRTPQQPGEAQAPQAAGELEELLRGLHRRRRGSPQASDRSDVYMCETVC